MGSLRISPMYSMSTVFFFWNLVEKSPSLWMVEGAMKIYLEGSVLFS